jgi:hypothetical protein
MTAKQVRSTRTSVATALVVAIFLGLGTAVLVLKGGGQAADLKTRSALPLATRYSSLATSEVSVAATYSQLPLSFEPNQGQTDTQVKFLSRGGGYVLFLTGDEAVLTLSSGQSRNSRLETRNWKQAADLKRQKSALPVAAFPGLLRSLATEPPLPLDFARHLPLATGHLPDDPARIPNPESRAPAVLRMRLVGANAHAKVVGIDPLPGKTNYFIGNDPKKWRTNIPNYARVKYRGVYPGVDLVYYGHQGQLEYDFVVAPGADPHQIVLDVGAGLALPERAPQAAPLQVNANGDLVVGTGNGEVRFHKPLIYQPTTSYEPRTKNEVLRTKNQEPRTTNKELIEGRYMLAGNHVSFEIGSYDRRRPLVIDPVILYSTYLGGSNDDFGRSIAVDASGNAYVTGWTHSTNFPVNSFRLYNESYDSAFVSKLYGQALVYSTYLGGSGDDVFTSGISIAVDSSGHAYVTGFTYATDFPTWNPFQGHLGGYRASNAFVTKFDPTGCALVYSTYLGGSYNDQGSGIAVDSSGDAYVTGFTYSSDFPTKDPFQPHFAGSNDGCFGGPGSCSPNAFATKFDSTGQALVYSTYLGGSGAGPDWPGLGDYGVGIAVDSSGDAYVTGTTDSTDFPTKNPFQPHNNTFPGGGNAFVTKFDPTGQELVYSTYLGGTGADNGIGIAVDSAGDAYVTGSTYSTDFPTKNPFQPHLAGGGDAFVTKFDPSGQTLVYSTYLGGSGNTAESAADIGNGIAVDSWGNAYVTGGTASADFPTKNPFQPKLAGLSNAFVTEFDPTGQALVYSSYLGGSVSGGSAIAVDSVGNAYLTGWTGPDFPTKYAAQPHYGGNGDAFVTKISPGTPAATSSPPIIVGPQ